MFTWIINLFSDRTVTFTTNIKLSAVASLLSGVIQGNVIGSLMFSVYINDLDRYSACPVAYGVRIKLFADDVMLYIKLVDCK